MQVEFGRRMLRRRRGGGRLFEGRGVEERACGGVHEMMCGSDFVAVDGETNKCCSRHAVGIKDEGGRMEWEREPVWCRAYSAERFNDAHNKTHQL